MLDHKYTHTCIYLIKYWLKLTHKGLHVCAQVTTLWAAQLVPSFPRVSRAGLFTTPLTDRFLKQISRQLAPDNGAVTWGSYWRVTESSNMNTAIAGWQNNYCQDLVMSLKTKSTIYTFWVFTHLHFPGMPILDPQVRGIPYVHWLVLEQ